MYSPISCPVCVMDFFANQPPACPVDGLLVASRDDASVPFSQAEETAGSPLYGSSSPVDEQFGSRALTLSTIPPTAVRVGVSPRGSHHMCEVSGEEDAAAAGGEEAAGRRILTTRARSVGGGGGAAWGGARAVCKDVRLIALTTKYSRWRTWAQA
ncbi:unnamed protein product [Urochloa humidicola]